MNTTRFGPHLELLLVLAFALGAIEVNHFDMLCQGVVKNILRLYISMAYPVLMQIL